MIIEALWEAFRHEIWAHKDIIADDEEISMFNQLGLHVGLGMSLVVILGRSGVQTQLFRSFKNALSPNPCVPKVWLHQISRREQHLHAL
jgi:hypothetical protein